jgi:hypothetical protein
VWVVKSEKVPYTPDMTSGVFIGKLLKSYSVTELLDGIEKNT